MRRPYTSAGWCRGGSRTAPDCRVGGQGRVRRPTLSLQPPCQAIVQRPEDGFERGRTVGRGVEGDRAGVGWDGGRLALLGLALGAVDRFGRLGGGIAPPGALADTT